MTKVTDRARSMFRTADAYSRTAQCIRSEISSDMKMLVPSKVIEALALELYCKALYYITHKKDFKIDGRHSHDFHTLFNKLPLELRDDMGSDFRSILQGRDMRDVTGVEAHSGVRFPRDLVGNIQEWSSVFVEFRYVYEGLKDDMAIAFFTEIEKVLRNAATGLKPDIQS